MTTRLLTGVSADLGLEFLVTVWESGEAELAIRQLAIPRARWITWSPPIALEETE